MDIQCSVLHLCSGLKPHSRENAAYSLEAELDLHLHKRGGVFSDDDPKPRTPQAWGAGATVQPKPQEPEKQEELLVKSSSSQHRGATEGHCPNYRSRSWIRIQISLACLVCSIKWNTATRPIFLQSSQQYWMRLTFTFLHSDIWEMLLSLIISRWHY